MTRYTTHAHAADLVLLNRIAELYDWLHDEIGCCATCSMDFAIIQAEKERGTNDPPERSPCQRKGRACVAPATMIGRAA